MHMCVRVCAHVFFSCARQEKLVPYQVRYLKGFRRRLSGVGVWWDVGVGVVGGLKLVVGGWGGDERQRRHRDLLHSLSCS